MAGIGFRANTSTPHSDDEAVLTKRLIYGVQRNTRRTYDNTARGINFPRPDRNLSYLDEQTNYGEGHRHDERYGFECRDSVRRRGSPRAYGFATNNNSDKGWNLSLVALEPCDRRREHRPRTQATPNCSRRARIRTTQGQPTILLHATSSSAAPADEWVLNKRFADNDTTRLMTSPYQWEHWGASRRRDDGTRDGVPSGNRRSPTTLRHRRRPLEDNYISPATIANGDERPTGGQVYLAPNSTGSRTDNGSEAIQEASPTRHTETPSITNARNRTHASAETT